LVMPKNSARLLKDVTGLYAVGVNQFVIQDWGRQSRASPHAVPMRRSPGRVGMATTTPE